ncbi:hypothetical protein [Marinobacter sp. LQ44]|uniref:hypothetical protein n=1 Tax=unclassified Marinobacter TaxID=83889 RepID=UPI000718DACA|nr:hypothetical protein [Marinobacter sp. LQ44]AMQ90173.1 hypothetical protein ASQ50_16570 [Marinobacter sp. LQ44]
MSSRIDLTLSPSGITGLLACAPWMLLGGFALGAALEASLWLLVAVPITIVFAWRNFQRYGLLRGPGAVKALRTDSGGITCQFGDGHETPVRVCASSTLGASCLILKLHPQDSRSGSIMVMITGKIGPFQANAPEPEFRRLRVWLRIGHTRNAH